MYDRRVHVCMVLHTTMQASHIHTCRHTYCVCTQRAHEHTHISHTRACRHNILKYSHQYFCVCIQRSHAHTSHSHACRHNTQKYTHICVHTRAHGHAHTSHTTQHTEVFAPILLCAHFSCLICCRKGEHQLDQRETPQQTSNAGTILSVSY